MQDMRRAKSMKLNEKQLAMVDAQIKRLIKTDS